MAEGSLIWFVFVQAWLSWMQRKVVRWARGPYYIISRPP